MTEAVPLHLRGNYAPVHDEITALSLPVRGSIPPGLRGRYVRNGPNPKTGSSPHWFLGDGMLHGVELADGAARWYRNRYVRTRTFLENAHTVAPDGTRDLTTGVANTHIVAYAGKMLALVETSFPVEVTRELETRGCYDFGGRLTTSMTAHPKLCPVTGELHFFGYSFAPPFLTYHRADAAGRLEHSQVIEVPGPTMIHDFAITERHVVFMDLPVVFDLERAVAGTMPYRWSDEYGARLGVRRRGAGDLPVRWLELAPCYVFHVLNAFDDGDEVVVDVARYRELWRPGGGVNRAQLHRWRADPVAGRVREEPLDDRSIEFPRCDERRTGLRHGYGYAVDTEGGADATRGTALVKYDSRRGAATVHDFGAGRVPGEGVFVPAAPSAAEDEGWVLTYVFDGGRNASDLVVLDAAHFSGPAVATVELPVRVPFGFHGSWFPDFA